MRAQARVSESVWRYLRDTCAEASTSPWVGGLLDVPLVADDNLTGGQWQIWEDGELTASGDIAPAPEGMHVGYAPLVGWYAYDSDIALPIPDQFIGEWR